MHFFSSSTQYMIQTCFWSVICNYYISKKAFIPNGLATNHAFKNSQFSVDTGRGLREGKWVRQNNSPVFSIQGGIKPFIKSQQIYKRHNIFQTYHSSEEKKNGKNTKQQPKICIKKFS